MRDGDLELLSRVLDGDLPPAEEAALRARLAEDPALADELAALQRVREGLARLAAGEAPPAVLDELVEPLRRDPPRRPAVRPALRWLAAAAAVVMGAAIGLEVQRRQPGPMLAEPAPTATPRVPGEYFQLRPLPTAEAGADTPLGASDRLLEQPLAEPTLPPLEPVPPMGPLPDARLEEQAAPAAPRMAPLREEWGERRKDAQAGRQPAPSGGAADGATAAPAAAAPAEDLEAVATHAWVYLELRAGEAAVPVPLASGAIPPGRHDVVLEIDRTGRIVRAHGATAPALPDEAAAARAVVGLLVDGAPPGSYRAVVVAPAEMELPDQR